VGSVPRRNTAQRRKPAKLIWDTQHLLEPAMNPGAENIYRRPALSRCVVAVPVSPFLSSPEGAWGRSHQSKDLSVASRPCRPRPENLLACAALHLRQQRCRPGRGRQRRHSCWRAGRPKGGPGGSRKPTRDRRSGARRGASAGQRLTLAGHQTTPRKGSASCMSKRLVALAAMKSCNEDEISASVSAARWANASATSEVASRDQPSTALKDTIRSG